jgi:hypothetical protein
MENNAPQQAANQGKAFPDRQPAIIDRHPEFG